MVRKMSLGGIMQRMSVREILEQYGSQCGDDCNPWGIDIDQALTALREMLLEELPKQLGNKHDEHIADEISTDDNFWDDQSQTTCVNLGYNKSIAEMRQKIEEMFK